MFGDGPKDMSHIYMGMALGSGRRAVAAEELADDLHDRLQFALGEKISWRSIATGYQCLCEAILEELANPLSPRVLSNPFEPDERARYLHAAVGRAHNEAFGRNKKNGNAKIYPDMLQIARKDTLDLVSSKIERLKEHSAEQIAEGKRRLSKG